MKANWDARKPVKQNLTEMGLAFDANDISKINSTKRDLISKAKGQINKEDEEEVDEAAPESEVVVRLKEEVKEAEEASKKPKFRFSKDEAMWIAGMMDRHGDDFKVRRERMLLLCCFVLKLLSIILLFWRLNSELDSGEQVSHCFTSKMWFSV